MSDTSEEMRWQFPMVIEFMDCSLKQILTNKLIQQSNNTKLIGFTE